MTVFYKAVDHEGLSFFPLDRKKRVNWVETYCREPK